MLETQPEEWVVQQQGLDLQPQVSAMQLLLTGQQCLVEVAQPQAAASGAVANTPAAGMGVERAAAAAQGPEAVQRLGGV